jgi:D-arabinose 1-dehydrogenase-like Zn-dependent alcohol dehydrogenase
MKYNRIVISKFGEPEVLQKVTENELPFSPGYDLVGIIDELGDDVSNLTIGQKVADLTVIGAYTEYICLDARSVVPVPENLDKGKTMRLEDAVEAHRLAENSKIEGKIILQVNN